MKKCIMCKTIKKLSQFHKDKQGIQGVNSYCLPCSRIKHKEYHHSKKGLVGIMYWGMKQRSKLRGHRPPEYSKEELREWLYSQPLFHELHREWKNSSFKKLLVPSVDRKHDDIHYCMSNIQLMTWGENKAKGHLFRKNGKNNSISKRVNQFTKDSTFIETYHSAMEAYRITNIHNTNISACLRGKRKTAGGYIWKED